MFGPNHIGSMPIPTLLRQGGVSTGLPAETQNYSVYLDGASDRISGLSMATTWLKVWDANEDFTLHFSIKLDALNSTISFSGTSTNYFWITVNSDGELVIQAAISSLAVGNYTFDTSLVAGTWYDIVLTSSAAAQNRTLNLYVNGVSTLAKLISTLFLSSTDIAAIPVSSPWVRS